MKKLVVSVAILGTLAGCGGGGNDSPLGATGGSTGTTGSVVPPPVNIPDIVASSKVVAQCAAPRPATVINPYTQLPYADKAGSLTSEKAWVRAYVNETYLWYQDVPTIDPSIYVVGATVDHTDPETNKVSPITLASNYDVMDGYFNTQRSTQFTASGKSKDPFHFTYQTEEWTALSTTGTSTGFGFQIALLASKPPRSAVIAYTDPGTIAALNGISRGTAILQVNGANVSDGDAKVLNEGLFSPVAGTSYTFVVQDLGSTTTRSVTMVAGAVTSVPVQNVTTLPAPYGNVGYLQFNDHIETAESQLIAAVNQLKAANNGAGITDLVLDLRYNGGGLLDIASEMAYMIAGSAATTGKTFEKLSFNDKNPFKVSDADSITPFHSTAVGFSVTEGTALPQLGLPRVFVLAGSGTCSASEAIINGLKGVGVQVILIGNTTCGKPYGFIPQDNCGTTYFTIQFKGVNNAGYGDYADGFVPGGSGTAANNLPGCVVADDFTKPLGDVTEARLAAALQYRATGSCSSTQSTSARSLAKLTPLGDAVLGRTAMRENRIYRPK